jgi:hypothetical protein
VQRRQVIGSGCPVRTPSTSELHPAWRSTRPRTPYSQEEPLKLQFEVLMRRVSPKHSERELYMYDVTMVRIPAPGICDFRGGHIRSHRGWYTKDSLKKVRVVRHLINRASVTSTSQAGGGIRDQPTDKQYLAYAVQTRHPSAGRLLLNFFFHER